MKSDITLNDLVEIEEIEHEIEDLEEHYCTYECIAYDNGGWCNDDCPILKKINELAAKADKLINN